MLVGSKSISDTFPTSSYTVRTRKRIITYEFRFGVAAILCWVVWMLAVWFILFLLVSKRTRNRLEPRNMRNIINRLMIGRALLELSHAGNSVHDGPSDGSTGAGSEAVFDISTYAQKGDGPTELSRLNIITEEPH